MSTATRDDRVQTALWAACGLALLWLLYLLNSILAPFLLAGILAYICEPLVARLERRRVPRVVAVCAVMLLLAAGFTLLVLTLVPLVREEIEMLGSRLPNALQLWNEKATPWIREHLGIHIKLRMDPQSLKKLITENWESSQAIMQTLLQSVKIGGTALLGVLANLLLAPVVMFYLLRDWRTLLARLDNAIPRPWHAKTIRMVREVDAVLAEFLRGQLMVMLAMAAFYTIGLWIAGVDFALPVGMVTGLLIFVPYLGYSLGLVLALLVALLQFEGISPLVGVAIVYGIGQALESFALTPVLVGERIGLHPLAVIFALLAFGQLFGFFGILLALPASAVLLVGLRELRRLYLASRLYRGADVP